MKKRLMNFNKNKTYITLEKLMTYKNIREHSDAVVFVGELIEQNVISAIPSSSKTFKQPALHLKYRIVKDEIDFDEYVDELNFKLFHKLDTKYYKSHLEQYLADRETVLSLSKYLMENGSSVKNEVMAVNERSLQIFNNEKKLSTSDCQSVLTRLGLSIDDLGVYKTPEPFFYYCNNEIDSSDVLIIENKDTWYTIREHLRKGKPILGQYFKAVIYGEGRKIVSSFKDIGYTDYSDFNSMSNTFYYFGDIDRGGVEIYLALKGSVESYDLRLFDTAYRLMLDDMTYARVNEYKNASYNKDEEIKNAFSSLGAVYTEMIIKLCKEKKILPQEIINNVVIDSYNKLL